MTEVVFASANIAHPRDFVHVRSPEALGAFAWEAGYDGVEMLPVYWGPERVARAAVAGELAISSVHMSFRPSKESATVNNEAYTLRDRAYSRAFGLLRMPYTTDSAEWMGRVQMTLGRRVPGVYFLQLSAERDRAALTVGRARLNTFQPTDDVARLMGVQSMERFLQTAADRGYDKRWPFCFDTFHGQRTYERADPGVVSVLDDETLKTIAQHTKVAHLGLGRTDIPGEAHIPTQRELTDVLRHGTFSGKTKVILEALKESGMLQHIVVEATAGSLRAAGCRKREDLKRAYQQIAAATREFMAET